MKKIIAVLLALIMVVSLLSGCSNTKEVVNDDTISVVVMDKGRCMASEGDMSNNRWTRYINENSKINVQFIPIARDNFEENLNLLMASGVTPDIIFSYEATYVEQMIDQGVIQPIGPYIQEHSTTCKEYLENNPELMDYLMFDGQQYAMTNIRGNLMDQGLWIRQDWLDKLGLSMPTTEEEFLNVCRRFKEAKLGGENTAPLALKRYCWGYFAPMYKANDQWYLNENGKVEYGVLTDRFMSSTQLLKTCYDEGLISKEFATDEDSSLAEYQWSSGQAGMLLFKGSTASVENLIANDPNADPVPVPPFETEYGRNGFYQSSPVNLYIMLSAQSKHPEMVIRYLDWLLDEGWHTLEYGIEGVHYFTDENNNPVEIVSEENSMQMSYISAYNLLSQRIDTPESIMALAADDELSQRLAKLEITSMEQNLKYPYCRNIPRDPSVNDYGILYAEWSSIELELMVKAITKGNEYSVEQMHEDLLKEWRSLKGTDVEASVQAWYDTNFKQQ